MSGQPLQGLGIKVEPSGKAYELGGLPDEELARVFVQPRTESHITLQYLDGNVPHIETVVGYIESAYCGKADVKMLPGDKVVSSESIDPLFCRKGWLDFM
jgi:hypothetical protein